MFNSVSRYICWPESSRRWYWGGT